MEAANRGATEADGLSIGLTISLPFEEFNNDYVTPDLHFHFHYFFMRKFLVHVSRESGGYDARWVWNSG